MLYAMTVVLLSICESSYTHKVTTTCVLDSQSHLLSRYHQQRAVLKSSSYPRFFSSYPRFIRPHCICSFKPVYWLFFSLFSLFLVTIVGLNMNSNPQIQEFNPQIEGFKLLIERLKPQIGGLQIFRSNIIYLISSTSFFLYYISISFILI